jgi:hypothetical protein
VTTAIAAPLVWIKYSDDIPLIAANNKHTLTQTLMLTLSIPKMHLTVPCLCHRDTRQSWDQFQSYPSTSFPVPVKCFIGIFATKLLRFYISTRPMY